MTAQGCKHPTLRFHSGGYYVECKECKAWWVAIRGAHSPDQVLDSSRGGDGLGAADERVKRDGREEDTFGGLRPRA